MTELSELSV